MDKKLFLIDAYSQIFRAFYAIRVLTDAKGRPNNALFVFGRLLLRLEELHTFELGAMLFDCGKPRFRMELNPEYKANRPPTPEELKLQIAPLRELASAFGWPLLEKTEYEADDLIGALAVNHSGPVEILSSDKDLAQLVSPRVTMLVPGGKNAEFIRRDEAEVCRKFAVPPERIVDYLALIGDASDNIPGVAGVGPKTAAAVIGEAGSVEEMLATPERIASIRIREKITSSAERLRKNLQLIRLRRDLPEELRAIDRICVKTAPDPAKIIDIAREWSLHALARDVGKRYGSAPATPAEPELVQGELF